MKIAFDSQIFTMQEYGGVSRYICNLVNTMSKVNGIEAKIFAPLHINSYIEDMPPKLAFERRVPRVTKTGRMVSAMSQLMARPMIYHYAPSIVHETYYTSNAYSSASAPRVVTVYDMVHELFASEFLSNDKTSKLKYIATKEQCL